MIKKYSYTQKELYKLIPALPIIQSCIDILVKEEEKFNDQINMECDSMGYEDFEQHPKYEQMLNQHQQTNEARNLYEYVLDHYLYMNDLSWVDFKEENKTYIFEKGFVGVPKISINSIMDTEISFKQGHSVKSISRINKNKNGKIESQG